MNPGALTHVIKIYAPETVTDESLGYVKADRLVCEVRAAVKGMRVSDSVEDGAERLNQMIQFTLRWRRDLDTSMAIRWQDRDYDVEYIDPTPFDGQYMRIRAVNRGGVGKGGAASGEHQL